MIAAQALVEGDLRAISPEQLASAKEAMQAIVAEALPHTCPRFSSTTAIRPWRQPTATDGCWSCTTGRAVTWAQAPSPRVIRAGAGAADISFTAGRVEMALDGIGLMGRDDHSEHETADLATLPSQTKRAAVLIYRLTHARRRPAGGSGGRSAVNRAGRHGSCPPLVVCAVAAVQPEAPAELLVVPCVDAPQPS